MANATVTNTTAALTGKTLATLEDDQTITGDLTLAGTNALTGPTTIQLANGSSSAPSLAFDSNPDTGMYHNANRIVFAVDAAEVLGLSSITSAGQNILIIYGYNHSATGEGPMLTIAHNSNGSGAPGTIALTDKDGVQWRLWVDTTGDLRIGTAAPAADGSPSDTSGTVVGTQS